MIKFEVIFPDNCNKCGENITNERPGCAALGQTFHVACFTCKQCGRQLVGNSFYKANGKVLCEQDYRGTVDRCECCGNAVTGRMLRALGRIYHPVCFTCSRCRRCLDGVPFTADSSNQTYCVACFYEKFAPRCAVCSQPIVPEKGEKESVRIVAMNKSFHVNCYRCEDCNMTLSANIDALGCYPLGEHIYCKACNGKRLLALSQTA
uniref:LIM zinc-binding domain-containing protein n=2 Tax=Parascaris univalens TaxID=6257 RepID=A0A915A384_PARUN